MSLHIRPTDMPIDAAHISRILSQYDPEPIAPESLVERAATVPPDWVVLRATALVDRQIVGLYHLRRMPTMKPGIYLATVAVDEAHRRKGYGSALLTAAQDHARSLGPAVPHAMVREDVDGAVEFFQKRGYTLRLTLGESTGDLDSWLPTPPAMPDGYRILDWASLPDNPQNRTRLFDLLTDCDRDEPGSKILGLMDYSSFERDAFEPGAYRPDWVWIAAKDDEWVGLHNVKRLSPDPATHHQAVISYTGVLPAHRSKGVATALKTHGLNRLKAEGVQTVLTHNDTTNAPMLRVNDKTGVFATTPGWAFMGKDLDR